MHSKYAFWPDNLMDFFKYPEKYYVKPFRIYGNLWFVGNKDVGAYILDTEEGLIMIDTGYPTTKALMIQSIWEAGFNPKDIRYILHTHGHFDHYGATSFIVTLSGAKTFLGAEDARMFKERPELSLDCDSRCSYSEPFKVDHVINDGDIISLGSTKIRCVSCPGHTMGVMCYFMELTENGKTLTAALYGGVGTNTVCRDSIEQWNTPYLRDYFIASLEKVRPEHVDIVLGNHTGQNDTLGKRAKMLENPDGPNPFIDPTEWETFINASKARYNQMLADEAAGTDQVED